MDTTTEDVRAVVREKYGEVARGERSCCGPSCCGGVDNVTEVALSIGYRAEDLKSAPEGANLGLGCGNPLEHADVLLGETVLDLGSGAGFDAFIAAKAVGPAGRVIGVEMTPSMIEKARANAKVIGAANVEFRMGEIEHLPVADHSVDVVISNCVINLSPDKPQVFREAFRALKPGGRVLLSDLVTTRPLSPSLRASVEAYVGCVAGASLKDEYLSMLREAGFSDISIVHETGYDVGLIGMEADLQREAASAVVSAKFRAVKPQK